MADDKELRTALMGLSLELEEALASELIAQGHRLTGALIESIDVALTESFNQLGLVGKFNDYGIVLDTGVPKERIPYSRGGPRRGGASKYITGLINWARIKFQVDLKRAKGIAFAVANTHLKKGMPAGGRAFTRWMTKTLEKKERRIAQVIGDAAGKDIVILIDNMAINAQKLIAA